MLVLVISVNMVFQVVLIFVYLVAIFTGQVLVLDVYSGHMGLDMGGKPGVVRANLTEPCPTPTPITKGTFFHKVHRT